MILTPPWGCGTLITIGMLIKDSRVRGCFTCSQTVVEKNNACWHSHNPSVMFWRGEK